MKLQQMLWYQVISKKINRNKQHIFAAVASLSAFAMLVLCKQMLRQLISD